MTIETRKGDVVIYQSDSEGIGEPALLLQPYSGLMCITQEDRAININYDTFKELIKAMNKLKQEHG